MSGYIDELLGCSRGADFLRLGLFPNSKEVTESFGAYAAVRQHLRDLALNDPAITMVAVGDGHTPRTAATFAMRSAWRCWSVDPNLAETSGKGPRHRPASRRWDQIDRLTVRPSRIEDVRIVCDGPCVIVAVHSHAVLAAALAVIEAPRVAVVAMPCCVPQTVPGREADIAYEDAGVTSPQRRVLVWRDVRAVA